MYNDISFGNKRYLEKKFMATGTLQLMPSGTWRSVSVAYANTYVCVELALTDKSPAKCMLQYIFVDDIVGIFSWMEEQLKSYINNL